MGIAVRRVRAVLPAQAGRRAYERGRVHGRRLQVARSGQLQMQRLPQPQRSRARLRPDYSGTRAKRGMAALDLRLSAGRRRKGVVLVASARFRRSRNGPSRRDLGSGQGGPRIPKNRPRRQDRFLAGIDGRRRRKTADPVPAGAEVGEMNHRHQPKLPTFDRVSSLLGFPYGSKRRRRSQEGCGRGRWFRPTASTWLFRSVFL